VVSARDAVRELADEQALERLVDRVGLKLVLEHLGNICEQKAEHIEEWWQDAPTAKVWREAAKHLDTARMRPATRAVSR
jgi:hypothetical protein